MAVCTDDDFIFDLCLDIEVGCTMYFNFGP